MINNLIVGKKKIKKIIKIFKIIHKIIIIVTILIYKFNKIKFLTKIIKTFILPILICVINAKISIQKMKN